MTTKKRRGARRPEPRRSRVPVLLGMLLVAVLSLGIGLGWYALRGANQRPVATGPNVVVLVLDGMDLWTWQRLPELQALLAGRTYTGAFVTDPESSPSRVSILTGQYPHNHGVLSDDEPIGGFGRSVRNRVQHRTIQNALHDAGYRTALVGEYLAGYGDAAVHAAANVSSEYVPPNWDRWYALAGGLPSAGPTINADGALVHPTGSLTDDLADQAVAFMTDASSPASYFLWLAPPAPSGTLGPAPAEPVEEELPPREEDATDKPAFLQQLAAEDPAVIADLQRQRLESMATVTSLVSRVLAAMDDNTYLIVTAATGYRLGQNGLPVGTGSAYEPDLRVPLIVIGPGVEVGEDSRLALNLDIAPTIVDLAGVTLAEEPDGLSLLDPPDEARDALAVEHEATATIPYYRALRQAGGVLYVEWQDGSTELYHLADDPTQDHNLAVADRADSLYGEEMTTLADRLHELSDCAGASCQ